MKKALFIGGGVFFCLVIGILIYRGAFQPQPAPSKERPSVAATIYPLYDITKLIAGDEIDVVVVLPPGTSPHTFEVTPSIVKKFQNTDVFFSIGHGLDNWALTVAGAVHTNVVQVDKNISLREYEEEHEDHEDEEMESEEEHHDHSGIDPHYWLSPIAASHIAFTIAEELSTLSPEHKDVFLLRAKEFDTQIQEHVSSWKESIRNLPSQDIVTFHNAFGYFAHDFGLNVVTTFEPFPGKEPTAQYLIALQKEIEEHNIHTLFLEPQLATDVIRAFADDNELNIGVLDPIGGTDGIVSYIDLIDHNVRVIVDALK